MMYKCIRCEIDKELTQFSSLKSILGHDKKCKQCRNELAKLKRQNKKLNKPKKQDKIKYRKCKSLINPVHPIPIKLTTMDGFGGYYKFDFEKLKEHLPFAKQHGQKNHMVKRKFKCWQVKSTNEINMIVFCDYINMDRKAIIKFEKEVNTVYVVNLYHPKVLELTR